MTVGQKRYPSVSILISDYNKGEKVKRNLDALLMQNYPNFRILILDNGSSDNTSKILSEYKDARISLFRLEKNCGAAGGNQFLLERVATDYFMYIDADDWLIGEEAIANFVESALSHDADMTFLRHKIYKNENDVSAAAFKGSKENVFVGKDLIKYVLDPQCLYPTTRLFGSEDLGTHWGVLIKTSSVRVNGALVKHDWELYSVGVFEDFLFICKCLKAVKKCCVIDKFAYMLNREGESTTANGSDKSYIRNETFISLGEIWKNISDLDSETRTAFAYFFSQLFPFCLDASNLKEFRQLFRSYKKAPFFSEAKKLVLKSRALKSRKKAMLKHPYAAYFYKKLRKKASHKQ